ncbi:MAG: bifunctional UDP-3-O-[3-hydroxymyristoyl] N-acetylglucosamine deacetylase/3-hydroxyacyl-ACP dehydratase [Bacteroidota bacterium]
MQHTQHTIHQSITLSGIGIHTGQQVHLTLLPAPADHGIKFQRVDVPDQPRIDAVAEHVISATRSTTLGVRGSLPISTVEHLMAALYGLEIDNLQVQLDGPEVPIMDGSAQPFVQALQQVGLLDQKTPRRFFRVVEPLVYKHTASGVELAAFPMDRYKLTVMISYDRSVLQNQYAFLQHLENFAHEIAPCRTFAFLSELEILYKQGLIQGGQLDNAVILPDKTLDGQELNRLAGFFSKKGAQVEPEELLYNPKLHYPNEPARHKLLDLIGDLALVGRPIQAHIVAYKPGHAANVAFANKFRKGILQRESLAMPQCNLHAQPVFDIKGITKMLPHRYPFQLIDKVMQIDARTITGVKNVTINEPFFQGHFPEKPIMPGVLQLEAMVQTGGILILHGVEDPADYATYFLAIDQCRFRKQVVPGDVLVMQCQLIANIKRGIAKMKGTAFVNNQLVCEAVMTAQIIRTKA